MLMKGKSTPPERPKLTSAHIPWAFPLVLVAIGIITGALNHPATNGYHGIYWFFSPIWLFSIQWLPIIGIAWGIVDFKTSAGKVAILLNLAALVFATYCAIGGGIRY